VKLLTSLVNHHTATPPDEKTPEEILVALEWAEGDSSDELVERAENAERVEASRNGK